jgi:hypothetical protein
VSSRGSFLYGRRVVKTCLVCHLNSPQHIIIILLILHRPLALRRSTHPIITRASGPAIPTLLRLCGVEAVLEARLELGDSLSCLSCVWNRPTNS